MDRRKGRRVGYVANKTFTHFVTAQVDRACLSVPKGCRETLHHACGRSRGGMRGEWEKKGEWSLGTWIKRERLRGQEMV